jgi:hypothetical protein
MRATQAAFVCVFSLIASTVAWGQIAEVGRLGIDGTRDVWSDGTHAFINTASQLFTIDISDPTQPTVLSQISASGGNDVKTANGYAYAGSVEIYDISNPTSPSSVASLPGNGHNVFVDNDRLYIANVNDVVPVYDVSDPTNPQFINNISMGGGFAVHDITVVDGRLYASGIGSGETKIFDVSNLTGQQQPPLLASWVSGSATHSSWPTDDGNSLVVARENSVGDIRIWDISDLSNPTLQSTIEDSDFGASAFSPHNPLLVGDTLYVSWYQAGLQVFDISDRSNPVQLGSFDSSAVWGVYPYLGPDRILLSDFNTDDLIIVDVRDVLKDGDFDGDSRLTCTDIDALVEQVVNGSSDLHFDTNADGSVTAADITAWLAVAGAANQPSGAAYLPGDANLDGLVDGEDFLIWNANKFTSQAAWCSGDFNADGLVNGGDFLEWNANKFSAADVAAVPEPTHLLLWLGCFTCWMTRRTNPRASTKR